MLPARPLRRPLSTRAGDRRAVRSRRIAARRARRARRAKRSASPTSPPQPHLTRCVRRAICCESVAFDAGPDALLDDLGDLPRVGVATELGLGEDQVTV